MKCQWAFIRADGTPWQIAPMHIPKPQTGRVLEPAWPLTPSVHHLRADGCWYSLVGMDDAGQLLWERSEPSALWAGADR
jgi:hypothetical protein